VAATASSPIALRRKVPRQPTTVGDGGGVYLPGVGRREKRGLERPSDAERRALVVVSAR